MSFTLTVLVAALVLLGTGFGLIAAYQGQLPVLNDWVGSGTSSSLSEAEIQQAQSHCELNRDNFCGDGPTASDCPSGELIEAQEWACRAQHNGRYCYEYWDEQENIESIPHCDGN